MFYQIFNNHVILFFSMLKTDSFGLKLAFEFFHQDFIVGLLRKNFHREEKEITSLKLKKLVRWTFKKKLTNLCLWRKSQQNTSFHDKSFEHIGRNIISTSQRPYMTDAQLTIFAMERNWKLFPLRLEKKTKTSLLPLLFYIVWEIIAKRNNAHKEIQSIHIGKEVVKLLLFAGDIICI